jgi:hypothetical protein
VSLTQTRGALCNNQVAFNSALVNLIDGEITAIVRSMSAWREAAYPVPAGTVPKTVATIGNAVQMASAMPGLASQGGPPPAPLPFTPQAVQELQKSVSQGS